MEFCVYVYLLCFSCAYAFEEDLSYYEFLKKTDLNRRVRRSVDPRPNAAIHEVWFESFGRKFHLLLKPSVPLSSDFKASAVHSDGSTSEFAVNKDLYFEGTSKTDPGSSVHLQWENDLAIISVNTKEEKYFFEVKVRRVLRQNMAASDNKHQLQSAQEHIPTCEKHNFTIDITCEDCDEFICSQCAKTDHKDHDWKTISTAGSVRRRELKKTLCKTKEEDVKTMDEKIQKATKLMENNQKCCDSEISKLQNHYDAIVSKLDEIKKNFETKLRENLKTKYAKVSEKKVDLEKKREHITDLLKFLEEKHNTMSDYSLIDNFRDLTNLVSNTDSDIEKGDLSLRYKIGDISEGSLESMMGQTFDLDDINVTERDAFQYNDNKDNVLPILQAINDDTCFVNDGIDSKCIERINIKDKKREKCNINVGGMCVTDNGDVYATDDDSNFIVRLSPSGSVTTVFGTDPLTPVGICQSTEGGLLVTLSDNESEPGPPVTHSRRLVRHVTLTGDFIREYEYQEDGQTRLFTEPWRVRQNSNTDICVVNLTSDTRSELVILSLSGSLKLVYRGKDTDKYFLYDVQCDSHCNIIVCETFYSKIHLLSPNGEFLKYLMTENEVTEPMSMSLYKSTLWVCNRHGLLKVFQYKS